MNFPSFLKSFRVYRGEDGEIKGEIEFDAAPHRSTYSPETTIIIRPEQTPGVWAGQRVDKIWLDDELIFDREIAMKITPELIREMAEEWGLMAQGDDYIGPNPFTPNGSRKDGFILYPSGFAWDRLLDHRYDVEFVVMAWQLSSSQASVFDGPDEMQISVEEWQWLIKSNLVEKTSAPNILHVAKPYTLRDVRVYLNAEMAPMRCLGEKAPYRWTRQKGV